MAVTPIALTLGISSIILLLLGWTYSVLFWIKYIYVKKILVPIVAFVAFCCGMFYLGPTVSFISLLTTGENIAPRTYYLLSYITMPLAGTGIVIMALNVFYPKLQKPAFIFYGIMCVVYYIFMFGPAKDNQFIAEDVGPGELLDISHNNVSLIVTGIVLLSVLVIDGGGFFLLALKLKKNNMPQQGIRKTLMIAFGWLLFVTSGIMDAMLPPLSITFIIFVRLLMIVAFNFVYLGFWSKPVRLEKKD